MSKLLLTRAPVFDLLKARRIAEALNVNADERTCVAALTDLAAVTARRPGDEDEADITFAAYVRRLQEYPPDCVIAACRDQADSSKWFPAWAELKVRLDQLVAVRRMLRQQLAQEPEPERIERREMSEEEREDMAEALAVVREALAAGENLTKDECRERGRARAQAKREKRKAS